MKTTVDLEKELTAFKLEHYKNMDVDYWFYKVGSLHTKFERLKVPKKQSRVIFELYLVYLQILEILFTNAHAVSVELIKFPSTLFIEPDQLKGFINDNFLKPTKFSTWFLTNYIFAIQKDSKDYQERYTDYEMILQECAKNYLDDYQLLNAYKHGFRVSAQHGKNNASIVDKKGNNQLLVESDSKITYFSKESGGGELKGSKVIFRRTINFKSARLFGKCALVITLIQNLRLTALHSLGVKGKEKVMQLKLNKDDWNKSFGSFSFKEPLFSLNQKAAKK